MGGHVKAPEVTPSGSRRASGIDALKLLEQTRRLEQLNAWFNIALNNMARGLSMFDENKRLIVCNQVYRDIYELPDELTQPGTDIADIVAYHASRETGSDTAEDRDHQRRWIERHAAELARGKAFTHTQHLRNGRIILVTNQPLADGGWVDIQEDVTEKARAEERIQWLARHDPLTEVSNRFHIREILEAELKAAEPGAFVVIHWIDLDRFKQVNDTLGHTAGDALLKSVAKRMCSTVRASDIVGRLGGDEFCVIQTGVRSAAEAEGLAKRLLSVLGTPYRLLGSTAEVGASIGIVMAPSDGTDPDDLLAKADVALYRVKSSGRGSYAFYRASDDARALDGFALERDLRQALATGALDLHYQPIVSLETGAVTSCEALMRWHHPRLGMVPPAKFIPVAESSGLIADLGRFALQRACRDAVGWPNAMKVTVNVSAVQFETSDLFAVVSEALASSGLDPRRLEIEITETVLMRDVPETRATLDRLRGLGIGIALDDFGTVFASLSYLRNFTFSKLKIDRSFVRDMTERKDCVAIVNAVAGLANALAISSVAEGIETVDQLDHVRNAGCSEVQGYYFSRPVPAAEVAAAVASSETKLSALDDIVGVPV